MRQARELNEIVAKLRDKVIFKHEDVDGIPYISIRADLRLSGEMSVDREGLTLARVQDVEERALFRMVEMLLDVTTIEVVLMPDRYLSPKSGNASTPTLWAGVGVRDRM